MSHGDTIPLHPSSGQSDIDEIENLIRASVQSGPTTVLPATVSSIPISSSSKSSTQKPPIPPSSSSNFAAGGFGSPPATLTEPVSETVKRDLRRIVNNLKQVVFPNPFREDPEMALRDWDLWGPFFFIVLLGLILSWSASIKKSEIFAVAFGLVAAGAVILTLNVLLLGGHIIFFQSVSLLGYCLFPLDLGALICMMNYNNVILKVIVATITLGWSSWAAYPFISAAVNPRRKALALYPLFLMYVTVGFLIVAIN